MGQVTGTVKFFNEKPWNNKILYSVKLQGDNNLYRLGEDAMGLAEGVAAHITFDTKEKNGQKTYHITAVDVQQKQQRAAPGAPANSGGGGGGVDRNASIVYQSSRKDALQFLALLIGQDIVKLPAKTKVQEREVAVNGLLDKYTAQFVADVESQGAVVRHKEAVTVDDDPYADGDTDEVYDD